MAMSTSPADPLDDPPSRSQRLAAAAGVVGPTAFIGAWALGAAVTNRRYSSIHDAISRLAAIGADSRPMMTAGFVVYGAGVSIFATAVRRTIDGPAWISALATGVATLAVAAAPLDHSSTVDSLHALFAGIGYATLAATPVLAARPLARAGHQALARLGVGVGGLAAVSLVLSTTGLPTGFFQRLGLTAGDVWIALCGLGIATGRLRRTTT